MVNYLETEREKLAYLYAQYANAIDKEDNEAVRRAYGRVLANLAWCLDDRANPMAIEVKNGKVIL